MGVGRDGDDDRDDHDGDDDDEHDDDDDDIAGVSAFPTAKELNLESCSSSKCHSSQYVVPSPFSPPVSQITKYLVPSGF